MMNLKELVEGNDIFQGYAYGYPHKTAYRPLAPAIPLQRAWEAEPLDALFLYAHVPFCEMRCGFCNLFTTTHPDSGLVNRYLETIEIQAAAVAAALGSEARFNRVALGGGTPTFLEASELRRLFETLHRHYVIAQHAPTAVELSPGTTTPDRLAVLREFRVTRASVGVQSFIESETRSLGRLQNPTQLRTALELLRAANFPVLNLDLIYGVPEQTPQSWQHSLSAALEYAPEEIYLYPLYVRPLTGLGRKGAAASDSRPELYGLGRDFLLAHGYRQISMRLFRKAAISSVEGPSYCCQEDGMVGLGPGSRSYTKALHYSSEWAVGQSGVKSIIADYVTRTAHDFSFADYGAILDLDEQRRRYVIKSLLRVDGLDLQAYAAEFGTDVMEDFPCLQELMQLDAVAFDGLVLKPSSRGLEWSDVIGPWLFSPATHERMEAFDLS